MTRTPIWRKALPVPADGKGNLRVYAKQDVGGAIMEVVLDYRDLPSRVVTEILKFVQRAKPAVHILRRGSALCGLPGLPKDWPEGHSWVGFSKDWPATDLDFTRIRTNTVEATCDACIKAANSVDK